MSTPVSRRSFLIGSSTLGLSLVGGSLLAACGGEDPTAPAAAGEVTWSLWGDSATLKRHQELNDRINASQSAVKASFVGLPTDGYAKKITAELAAGNAPDVFLVGDTQLGQLIKDGSLAELGPLLDGPLSKSTTSSFNPKLLAPGTSGDGKVYGVPAACNPMIMWFNSKVLEEAGVTTSPADSLTAGSWTADYFQTVLDKVKATGKRAFVFSNWNGETYPWLTSRGGKIFDGGQFVAHEDPKTIDTIKWLRELLASETIWYASALPQGQGADAMFMADQLAFTLTGRWVVPQYRKQSSLRADVVPLPSADGSPSSTIVLASYLVINKATKNVDNAFRVFTEYLSKEGQSFILDGDLGLAVPSITGADSVVLSGNYPAHAQTFLDQRDSGYSSMVEEMRVPGLSGLIFKPLDKYFTEGGDLAAIMSDMGRQVNAAIQKGSV